MPERTLTDLLAFTDIETTGLDPLKREVLEVAVRITTKDLTILGEYQAVLKLTSDGLRQIQNNEHVLKMHSSNGLITDAAAATKTLGQVDREVRAFLLTFLNGGAGKTISMAGSGTERFDLPWIQEHLPESASLLTYYTYDIGVFRRITALFNDDFSIIPPVEASYLDGVKAHRAMADVIAHYEEFQSFRNWFRDHHVLDARL